MRGGHHCAQPLVRALGVAGAARASLAPYNDDANVEALLDGVEELARKRPVQLRRPSLVQATK